MVMVLLIKWLYKWKVFCFMILIVILLVKILMFFSFVGLFCVFVLMKYVDFLDFIVIILMLGFSCFKYMVILVVKLLLFMVINKILRCGFCFNSFCVIVFWFVIILGLLKGGMKV